jgi:hypothetical protein
MSGWHLKDWRCLMSYPRVCSMLLGLKHWKVSTCQEGSSTKSNA